MKTARTREITPLFNAALQGDEGAKAFFKDQWTDDTPCFFCDQPSGPNRSSCLFPDPRIPKMTVMVPVCSDCDKIPLKQRQHRDLKLLQAMWPRGTWVIK